MYEGEEVTTITMVRITLNIQIMYKDF